MSILGFIFHSIINALLGWGILNRISKLKGNFEKLFLALLLGMLAETTVCFLLMWLGLSHKIGLVVAFALAVGLNFQFFKNFKKLKENAEQAIAKSKAFSSKFKWYDWLLVVLIFEKFTFTLWQLIRIPVYHSDTMKHWATQAHAIFGGVNWSMEIGAVNFMAINLKVPIDYPLNLPIWAANNAFLSGGWSDFSPRVSGLFFLIVIAGIIGSTFWRLTKNRSLALGSVLIITALPLQVWHAASGYGDIGVEAFLVAALAVFLRKEWVVAGLLLAGAGWCKNDGIAIYFAGFAAMFFSYQLFEKRFSVKEKMKNAGAFLLGYAIIFPWLFFQSRYHETAFEKMLSPLTKLFSFVEKNEAPVPKLMQVTPPEPVRDSLPLFYDYVLTGSSHGMFWLVFLLGFAGLLWFLLKDNFGRSLVIFTLVTLAVIYYVFSYTPAYEYLVIQTTIHRTMLQFSAAALLVLGYGLGLVLNRKPVAVQKIKKVKKRN